LRKWRDILAWQIEFEAGALKDLERLDKQVAHRILRFLRERVVPADNPRSLGKPLVGSTLGDFWRYRVGDYRIIVKIEDEMVRVVVVRVGSRKDVYRRMG
jgi:mRNA interferase RelE/StbE